MGKLLDMTGWVRVEGTEGASLFKNCLFVYAIVCCALYHLPAILDNLLVIDLIMLHHLPHRMEAKKYDLLLGLTLIWSVFHLNNEIEF